MKKMLTGLVLFISLASPFFTKAQTTVDITGTIKSAQGALQGATITFVSQGDEFLGNCVSGPDGKFKSQYRIAVGKTIKIRITSKDYEDFEKTFTIDRTGNAGEFMLGKKMLIISGFVKDSISELAMPGVEVFFYDGSKVTQSKSTNSQGYFQIETNFVPGQRITIRLSKAEYYDKEETLTFASEGKNTLPEIKLPKIGDRGLRAYITVLDKKNEKPLKEANIHYLERKRSTFLDTAVAANGKVELKLYQQPGTILEMEISSPNYRTLKVQQTLSMDPAGNLFTYKLEKNHKSVGTFLLVGGSVAAVVSGAMYISSNSKYESYKDFGNANRESDYDKAQSARNISIAAGAVAVGCFIGYFIHKASVKKKEKAAEDEWKGTGFKLLVPSAMPYAAGQMEIIGVAYQF